MLHTVQRTTTPTDTVSPQQKVALMAYVKQGVFFVETEAALEVGTKGQ